MDYVAGSSNEKCHVFDLHEKYKFEDGRDEVGKNDDERKNVEGFSIEDLNSMTFENEEEAYDFYQSISRNEGFSVRKSTIHRYKNGKVRTRLFVCSREGERSKKDKEKVDRQREPRGETRVGCVAHLRVKYDRKKEVYVVASFNNDHNHPLTPQDRVQFLRSHRNVRSSVITEAHAMSNVGIKCSKIMDYMVQKHHGYEHCGFTEKDLSNALYNQNKSEMLAGDAESSLAYFSAKKDSDPEYYFKYELDEASRLDMIFWADSKSRYDYACFGDVLAFDATYRTNVYNRPFVMLVGVNNHYQTIIFGCALLPNEFECTYKWLLTTFLDAMRMKRPTAVITDDDKAMRNAIASIIPDVKHRLCKWHIQKNVTTNIHLKGFIDDFTVLMDDPCMPEEFERQWTSLVCKYGLENNAWISKLYNNRKLWATTYLKGTFFANMRTTGRESFNHYFNTYLNKKLWIYKFIQAFDRALLQMRHCEAREIHKSEETQPVEYTKLYDLERHAAVVYTRNMFYKVRSQIELSIQVFGLQSVINDEGEKTFYLSMYNKSDDMWVVRYDESRPCMQCTCLLFESTGIPCCHLFEVMKVLGMKEIPNFLIMDRWTKRPKFFEHGSSSGSSLFSTADDQIARYGSLMLKFSNLAYLASHSQEGWKLVSDELDKLTCRLEELKMANDADMFNNTGGMKRTFGVGDPTCVNTRNPGTKKLKSKEMPPLSEEAKP